MDVLSLWRDLKLAGRGLARQPLFSLMSIGILALGIAGTVMVFGLFNGLLLHPLPVPEAHRVAVLEETAPPWGRKYMGMSYPDFCAWRDHNQSFESMYAGAVWGANLSHEGQAQRVTMIVATHEYFQTMRIQPVLGRCFREEEDRWGGPKVVLLSTGLWDRVFGKDPAVLGQTLQLDGQPFTILGVLPPQAEFPNNVDLWRPLAANPEQERGRYSYFGAGRLKEGVTIAQAYADLARIHQGLIAQNLADPATLPVVESLPENLLGTYWRGFLILFGAVGGVLLIACCNVTSIMLARGTQRGREIALCLALGATRRRIVAQVLMESALLSVAGALAGAISGRWLLDLVIACFIKPLDSSRWLTFQTDFRWALFCILAIGAVALLSGMIPALHAVGKRDLHGVLQASGTRSTDSYARRRTLNAVVVGQVALALTLLIGAGLVFRSFQNVQRTDPGFRRDGVLTYRIDLPYNAYPQNGKRQMFFEQHLEKVRTLPGVIAAGLVNTPPMCGVSDGKRLEVEGRLPGGMDEKEPTLLYQVATPGYLEAMGIKLLSGRLFSEQDNQPQSEPTAIVNESLARLLWPAQDPLDKRIRVRGEPQWMRVIAVVGDVRHDGLEKPAPAGVYVPYGHAFYTGMFGVVRTQGDPFALVPALREIVHTADPDLPVHNIQTMPQRVHNFMVLRVMYSWMFGAFGVVAGIMAFAGIYGVAGYWVGQRTQEIGIRMALGARRPDVIRMVIRQGLRLIALGLVFGMVGALGASRLIASTLYDLSPTDPLTYAGVGLLLVAAGILACYLPAQRAAKIDPMVALRCE